MLREEECLVAGLNKYGIKGEHRESIERYLGVLRARSEETFRHSVRVGILAARIGEHLGAEGIKAKTLLWAGLLHDIGKALVDPDLFEKKDRFTEEDYKRMEPHVEYGFRLLRQVHEWTAHIIVRHHRFGKRPYPAELPMTQLSGGELAKTFDLYARLLALADYYDALTTRDNDKFGRQLSADEKRDLYLRENADQKELILELIKAGVLMF